MTHKAYLQDSYEDALRKNLELQAQLASWEALGRELVAAFELNRENNNMLWCDFLADDGIYIGAHVVPNGWIDEVPTNRVESDKLYQVLSRLLELTSE